MKTNKCRLAIILTIIFTINFTSIKFNFVSAQTVNNQQTEANPNNFKDSSEDATKSKAIKDEDKNNTTKTSPDSNNLPTEASKQNLQVARNESFLTAKNLLLLFAIIDLPIIALLLTLWFLNNKQQSKNYQKLSKRQDAIAQQFNKLEGISSNSRQISELQTASKKIIEQIQENKQEIINSRISVKDSIEKLTVSRPINSYDTPNISLPNNYSSSSSNNELTEQQSDNYDRASVAVADLPPQFVAQYNQNSQSISNEIIATVVPTKESLNKQRLGEESKLILEETTRKKYWIIQEDNNSYLVPHAKIKIDEYNITILEAIFDCIDFSSDFQYFQLVKPAKVFRIDSELWQLEQKGKLAFS